MCGWGATVGEPVGGGGEAMVRHHEGRLSCPSYLWAEEGPDLRRLRLSGTCWRSVSRSTVGMGVFSRGAEPAGSLASVAVS